MQLRLRTKLSVRAGSFHESDFRYFTRFAGRRATFLDIGANIGQSIISFKTAAPDCIVYSFEPNPRLFQFASDVARKFADVYLHQQGLGEEACSLTLYTPIYRRMHFYQLASTQNRNIEELAQWLCTRGFTYLTPGRLTTKATIVPIVPLDSMNLSPNAIKIDVEGAEPSVIKGGWETIKRTRPPLLIESGEREGIVSLLAPLGYKPYTYDVAHASLKAGAGDPNTFLLA